MSDTEDFIKNGDVLTIAGIYADGTKAPNEGPIDHSKPMKKWRAVEFVREDGITAVRLQPLNEDGTVDEFNDCCGDFRIVAK